MDMHSNPYILTRPGDYTQYFGRHPEEHYYRYNSVYYSCDSDSEQLARGGPEWQSMPTPVLLEPHENDVLMGRGGRNNQHSGNEILRHFARSQGDNYRLASKKGKSAISRLIVRQMRDLNPPARFLKRVQQTAAWEEVSEDTAREKASQVLRDAVAGLLEEKEEVPSVQPLPTVSAPVSTDEHDQASSRVSAVRSRADFHPPLPNRSESSDAKRRRYNTDPSNLHSIDERNQSQQLVGYSPIRRHSESNYHGGARSDPTSRRTSHNTSSPHTVPGTTTRLQHQNLGNLDEFDLFNGELLESDLDEEGPLPPDTHSGIF